MAIGHHIQDRAHIVQKAKNNKTGDEELNQEFFNLDESKTSVDFLCLKIIMLYGVCVTVHTHLKKACACSVTLIILY